MAQKKKQTFPLLNTEEAEEIVRELGRALDDHREWNDKFRTMLVCRTKPKADDLDNQSPKKTAFGRWYLGKVNPHLRDHPGFPAIGKNSERMHKMARNLARLIRDDAHIKPSQYKAFVKSVDQFRRNLRKLLSEAWYFLRYTDPLTGVMTRTAMQSRLEEERERIRRGGQTCCVGIMDLDHFKRVNDTHGHQAGDKVLQSVAGYVIENLRRYDQVFRYGGEEFVFLLPNSTLAQAKGVLDRLRRGVKRQAVKISGAKSLHVSASFGVAELLPDLPVNDSIDRADQALYTAKSAGRNRVHLWPLSENPKSRKK